MAKPKIALVPSAQGSKFYSVLPSSGVGDFAFSRSGSATRINKDGLIETVGNGVSRLNYPLLDGVVSGCPHHILEPQRTNSLIYSEDFSKSIWTKDNTNLTSGFISPDGTANAYKLTENTSNSRHRLYSEISTVNNGATLSTSIFVKSAERSWILLRESTTDYGYYFNNGIVGSKTGFPLSYNIESFPNGWYRYTVTTVTPNTSGRLILSIVTEDGGDTYQGDGTSGVYVWGAMLEEGSYPTSYIPTNGSTATRSAETANGSGDADTFNDSEGVLMAEISALDLSNYLRELSISDGTTSNRIQLRYYDTSDNKIEYRVKVGGSTQSNALITLSNAKEFNKIALKYKLNDFALWVNGLEVFTDTSGSTFSANTLSELSFDKGDGSNPFYGNTKQIQYYDSALTDSELETLTSWVSFRDMAEGQQYSIK
jgi:hypothetical protein